MRRSVLVICILFALPAAAAPGVEIGAHYAFVDPSGSNDFRDIGSTFDLESGDGYGLSLGFRLGPRWSIEGTASQLKTDAALAFEGGEPFALGTLEMTAVTATVRMHLLGDSALDPFIGGGAAWVDASTLDDETLLDELDLREVEFDGGATWVAEAGVRLRITPSIVLSVTGKYIAFEPDSTAIFADNPTPSDPVKIVINPVVVTAGIHFRF